MSAQVSCPVFRCPKDSVARCAGYGKTCDRYYCRTHAEGTLCDRCAGLKREALKAGYKQMLGGLVRQSYRAGMTRGVAALCLASAALLLSAALAAFWRSGTHGVSLPFFVVSLGGGALGLIAALFWYLTKTREFVRGRSVELDLSHPGFYDYYRQWQEKFDEATTNTPSDY